CHQTGYLTGEGDGLPDECRDQEDEGREAEPEPGQDQEGGGGGAGQPPPAQALDHRIEEGADRHAEHEREEDVAQGPEEEPERGGEQEREDHLAAHVHGLESGRRPITARSTMCWRVASAAQNRSYVARPTACSSSGRKPAATMVGPRPWNTRRQMSSAAPKPG